MHILNTDEDKEIEDYMVVNHGESRGNQLLCYLQVLIAWPGAVNGLLDNEFRILLNDNISKPTLPWTALARAGQQFHTPRYPQQGT